MSFIQSFGECDISLLKRRLFHGHVTYKGTCKHMAPSPMSPEFHFLGQPVFLQVLTIFPLDVHLKTHEEKEGRGEQLHASWYLAGCVLSADGHKLWAAAQTVS